MTFMNEFNPDAYCGIYCGACSIAMSGETGRTDGFAACLGGVPKEDLSCGGCKSGTVYAGCSTCNIRRCAREKDLEHCIDCAQYPCKIYSSWQSAAKFLVPHSRDAVPSLETIRRDGVASWLRAQRKRWSCPDCGAPFSWYAPTCYTCGRSLASAAYTLSGWRKLLCRIVLPMAYRKGKTNSPAV
ncbi:MAG: DUF3795 domain-containing protein [Deltaproteobacteria bacterium]|nr:DUF3795 domain-containing protein [Deltaproteobacteria bacterium]